MDVVGRTGGGGIKEGLRLFLGPVENINILYECKPSKKGKKPHPVPSYQPQQLEQLAERVRSGSRAHYGAELSTCLTKPNLLGAPLGRPLTIDHDDYCLPKDDARFASEGGQALRNRLLLGSARLTIAIMRTGFGFQNILAVHTGSKGVHVHVLDGHRLCTVAREYYANVLRSETSTLAEYVETMRGMIWMGKEAGSVGLLALEVARELLACGPADGGVGFLDGADGAQRRAEAVAFVMAGTVQPALDPALDGVAWWDRFASSARATQEAAFRLRVWALWHAGGVIDYGVTAQFKRNLRLPFTASKANDEHPNTNRCTPLPQEAIEAMKMPAWAPLTLADKDIGVQHPSVQAVLRAVEGMNGASRPRNPFRQRPVDVFVAYGYPAVTEESRAMIQEHDARMQAVHVAVGAERSQKRVRDVPDTIDVNHCLIRTMSLEAQDVFCEMHCYDTVPSTEWPQRMVNAFDVAGYGNGIPVHDRNYVIPHLVCNGIPPDLVAKMCILHFKRGLNQFGSIFEWIAKKSIHYQCFRTGVHGPWNPTDAVQRECMQAAELVIDYKARQQRGAKAVASSSTEAQP